MKQYIFVGTYHQMSVKHLDRYVLDTINQMTAIAQGLVGKNLRYRDLVA